MLENATITLSQPDRLGQFRVEAKWSGIEYLDCFNPVNEWRRRTFAENALSAFGWTDASAELVGSVMEAVLDELKKLERSARRDDEVLETPLLREMRFEEVNWLWPERIAFGKLSVIAGDPGLGKSLLTLDIAAHASRGAPWPDESGFAPVTTVLLLSAEDDFTDTIGPRLAAADADFDRIHVTEGVSSGSGESKTVRMVDIAMDLEKLRERLRSLPEPRLMVIDPISAYLGSVSENANAEVRGLLRPLAELAAGTSTAIVLVSHLRKAKGPNLHRIIGSIAFAAVSRTAFVVLKVKEAGYQERRLVPVKSNLSGGHTALRFRIEEHPALRQPRVIWGREEACEAVADPPEERGRPPSLSAEAVARIDARLATGPATFAELRELLGPLAPARRTLYDFIAKRYQWLDKKQGRAHLIGLKSA
jgi:hypothetical protein